MSTPDVPRHLLFAPESDLERAICALFSDSGIPAFANRGYADLPIPRVDVSINLGAARDKLREIDSLLVRHTWDLGIKIDVVTTRDKATATLHPELCGQVRWQMRRFPTAFDTTILPYHEVAAIIESGTEFGITAEDNCDVSSISFTGTIGIR